MTSLGIKRSCQACGCKYYDFNKAVIVCPSCEAEFDPEVLLKSRRLKPISAEKPKSAEAPETTESEVAPDADIADVADVALSEDDIEAGDNEDAVDDDSDAPIINVRETEDDEESIKSDNPITSDFLDDAPETEAEAEVADEEIKDDDE